jgi:VIT1/CCC1 family predicted Fe2+/Mn2+ transporter
VIGIVGDKNAVARAATGGSTAYGFVNMDEKSHVAFKHAQEDYFADKVSKNLLLNLDGYMNVSSQKNSEGNQMIAGILDKQLGQLHSLLANFGDTREVNTAFASNFVNQMKRDAGRLSPAAKQQYKELFNQLGKTYQSKGSRKVYEELVNTKFKEIYNVVGMQQGEAGFVS